MMLLVFSKAKVQKIISASLAVWLSGFVFLLCCGMMEAQAAETEFCPLAKAEKHCDKTKADENQTAFAGESGPAFDCCYFLPAVFDKVRKIEKIQQSAPPADKIKIDSPHVLLAENHFEQAETYQTPARYQSKIYIANCVFRI